MGEIVNLRRVKKSLAHAAATVAARENRVKHGRTKAEKANDARTAVRQEAAVADRQLVRKPDDAC